MLTTCFFTRRFVACINSLVIAQVAKPMEREGAVSDGDELC